MLLPGPEAQQLATYIGWLIHRTWGGIAAGVLFVVQSHRTVLDLPAIWRCASGQGHLLWHQAGRNGPGPACSSPHRFAGAAQQVDVGYCRYLLRGDFHVRNTVSSHSPGRGVDRALWCAQGTRSVRIGRWSCQGRAGQGRATVQHSSTTIPRRQCMPGSRVVSWLSCWRSAWACERWSWRS